MAGCGGPLLTLGERVMRDGLRFCSVAADLEACHDDVYRFDSALTSQNGQSDEEMRNMAYA